MQFTEASENLTAIVMSGVQAKNAKGPHKHSVLV